MSHFEDAFQMNINLDRQHEMIRGNCCYTNQKIFVRLKATRTKPNKTLQESLYFL